MVNSLKYGILPVVVAVVIFYLCCLLPPDAAPEVEFILWLPADKVYHFVMYFGLAGSAAAYYVWDKRGNVRTALILVGAGVVPILYGGAIEIVQALFFPLRAGDWFDFLADAIGVLAAMPAIFALKWVVQYITKRYALWR
jgi:VanZ family protein